MNKIQPNELSAKFLVGACEVERVPDEFPIPAEGKVPGAYVITHESTGLFYIGSAVSLNGRVGVHKAQLKTGKHEVPKMQEAYDHDQEITVEVFRTTDRESAYALEQKLLDQNIEKEHCTNKSSNVRSTIGVFPNEVSRRNMSLAQKERFATTDAAEKLRAINLGKKWTDEAKAAFSRSRTGTIKSDEGKANHQAATVRNGTAHSVSVNGQEYPSLAEASRQTGINLTTLWRRSKSSDPKSNVFVKLPNQK